VVLGYPSHHCPEDKHYCPQSSGNSLLILIMPKIFVYSLSFFLAAFASLSLAFLSQPALADSYGNYGLDETVVNNENLKGALNADAVGNTPGLYLTGRVGKMVGVVLSFVGVIFLVLIIYAGIKWMTSGGNDKSVESAKSLIISAIIGLIIVLGAYAITAFIGRTLTATN
jgi:hypothetical protein